jgi:catechol 2,3-dioxygenase-like lactoylglutathione lyase family enzyme
MTFLSFSHIYLPVRDVDESIKFNTENLGFKLLRKYRTSSDGEPSAYLELGDTLLELTKARGQLPIEKDVVEPRIGITVDNMDAAWSALMKNGVESARDPFDARTFWGKQAQIKDPNGYGISLREWEAPDGPHYEGWQPRHEGGTRLA